MAVIAECLDDMLGAQRPGERAVQVVEARLTILVIAVIGQELQHPVGISGPGSEQERQLVLNDGHLQGSLTRQHTQAGRAVPFLLVGIAGSDVHHR